MKWVYSLPTLSIFSICAVLFCLYSVLSVNIGSMMCISTCDRYSVESDSRLMKQEGQNVLELQKLVTSSDRLSRFRIPIAEIRGAFDREKTCGPSAAELNSPLTHTNYNFQKYQSCDRLQSHPRRPFFFSVVYLPAFQYDQLLGSSFQGYGDFSPMVFLIFPRATSPIYFANQDGFCSDN